MVFSPSQKLSNNYLKNMRKPEYFEINMENVPASLIVVKPRPRRRSSKPLT